MESKPKTILMLNANPHDTSPIRLDEEAREIRRKLREANLRDLIRLETLWAVRPDEIQQGLNQYEPEIVHFSGHGTEDNELIVSSSSGAGQAVSSKALVALFDGACSRPQAVVLNSCFSAKQADEISEHVGVTIGMLAEIGIEAAVVFAGAFYSALGYGKSYAEAFRQSRTSLLLHGIAESDIPKIYVKAGFDASTSVLADAEREERELPKGPPLRKFHMETSAKRVGTVVNQQADSVNNEFKTS